MRLHAVTLLVDDCDSAISHCVEDLGFTLVEDTARDAGKRWVRVSPDPDGEASLLLAVATTPAQGSATRIVEFLFIPGQRAPVLSRP